MRIFHYLEIENFKRFGERQRIELDHPTVLIGPNNCGKTTALQAIALWSQAVRTWWDAKGEYPLRDRPAVVLNRTAIVSVPVRRTRHLWHDLVVRKDNRDVPLRIAVGVEHDGRVEPVAMRFRNHGDDLVYCVPDEETRTKPSVLCFAAGLEIGLLYPMSNIEIEEPVLQPSLLRMLLGQGQTASVLRNLCLMAYLDSPKSWSSITDLVRRLFSVRLGDPEETDRGSIDLAYRREGASGEFDISFAGPGLRQVLLILAYLHSGRCRVLLLDEPDDHLGFLLQRQVYVLLRDLAARRNSQVVMATHSEVLLRDALDDNLTLLFGGRADNLANEREIADALRHYGAEHYVRARQTGHVLYLEGRSDLDVLMAFAERLSHPVLDRWDETPNVFFVRDNYPDPDLDSELERVEGGYGVTPQKHFSGIRGMVSGLRGLAILDSDGRSRADTDDDGLRAVYWRRYEIENYFITPVVLRDYALLRYGDAIPAADLRDAIESALDAVVRERVFRGSERDFRIWKEADEEGNRLVWEACTERVKVSALAEAFFRDLAEYLNRPVLLRKRDFRELVPFIPRDAIPAEVEEKLDLLKTLLDRAEPCLED